MFARDIMIPRFHTLRPEQTVAEAVKMFHIASTEEQKRINGLMVIDEKGQLAGILSIYDILLFVQPKHIHVWSEIEDLEVTEMFDELLNRVKTIRVSDIMTTNVVTVKPQTHVMFIADLMIKKHIRLVPVVEGKNVVGVVYIADLFYHTLNKFL
jgi:CBS domain-containing protein